MPPTETREQIGFVLRFTAGTLYNVLFGIGVRAPERAEFWRFFARLLELRAKGRIASVLEVLLRVTPNAHHLITWGRTLIEDHERGLRSLVIEVPRPRAKGPAKVGTVVIEGRGEATPSGLVPLKSRKARAATA